MQQSAMKRTKVTRREGNTYGDIFSPVSFAIAILLAASEALLSRPSLLMEGARDMDGLMPILGLWPEFDVDALALAVAVVS